MRYILVALCIWSSISVFTYTEIFPPTNKTPFSAEIQQIMENYADFWNDGALL